MRRVMAQEKPNRLAEWLMLAREQWPVLRQGVADWAAQCREEPALIWATPLVRYGTYIVLGLIGVGLVFQARNLIAPASSAVIRPRATMADFHVLCSDRSCRHHFVIHRKFGFDDFPVVCAKCKKRTGEHARPCNSQQCRRRWVAPVRTDAGQVCPYCGTVLEP